MKTVPSADLLAGKSLWLFATLKSLPLHPSPLHAKGETRERGSLVFLPQRGEGCASAILISSHHRILHNQSVPATALCQRSPPARRQRSSSLQGCSAWTCGAFGGSGAFLAVAAVKGAGASRGPCGLEKSQVLLCSSPLGKALSVPC